MVNPANFEKWDWSKTEWRCAWCDAPGAQAVHQGKHGPEPHPYNRHQRYCCEDCREAAKEERRSERRAEAEHERRAGFRCVACGGPWTNFVRGKRKTCSSTCAGRHKAELQTQRRQTPQDEPDRKRSGPFPARA
jgi:hypothetical protein